jgi:hypothetical protein
MRGEVFTITSPDKNHHNTCHRPLLPAPLTTLRAAESAKLPAKLNILSAITDDSSYGHAGAFGCK